MSQFFVRFIETVEATTMPEKEEVAHSKHARLGFVFLVLRNIFVALAVILFVTEFFVSDEVRHALKASAYFCGAIAYLFECFIETDFFTTKVSHHEMFMLYCFGPLYILLGLSYIF